MNAFVSNRRFGVFALVASLSVVWVGCAIYAVPPGLPWMAWMGLGWAGLALSVALQVSIGSTRSIAQVLHDVEAEPVPAVAAKSGRLAARMWVSVVWLSLSPALLLAALPDPAANLSACRNGRPSSEPSRLTEGARAQRQRVVSDCKDGLARCNHSELTQAERKEVALAERQRNLANCRNGWDGCDYSKLSEREAAEVAGAVNTRNTSDCQAGRDTCDYSLLEAQALTRAERVRNYTACRDRRGYCDRSRLTPSEAASIPPEVR